MGKGDSELKAANARLKAARVRVAIQRRGDWLSLRTTLPPKPGSGKDRPTDQRISLGIAATSEGIRMAEAEAMRLRSELTRERFSWANWGDPLEAKPETAGQWIEKWHEHLLKGEKYQRSLDPRKKWVNEQWCCGLSGLLQNEPVSLANCLHSLSKKRGLRARQLSARNLMRFAKFCGVEIDLSEQAKGYSLDSVKRNIPTTEQVLECYELIPEQSPWRSYYAKAATYGLRPHEVFLGEVEWVEIEGGDRVLGFAVPEEDEETGYRSKTGARLVAPLPREWVDRFGIREGMPMPKASANFGHQANQRFKGYGIPFKPYDLRHHYNLYGSTVAQLNTASMAGLMGHSSITNARVYQRGLNSAWAWKAYSEATKH